MSDDKDTKDVLEVVKVIEPERGEHGYYLPGHCGNPKKIYASKKKEVYRRIMDEAGELLDIAIADAKGGNKKMLIFLLSRILPQRGIIEVSDSQIKLSERTQDNVKSIMKSYNKDELTIADLVDLLTAIQKQSEIQSSDLFVLNAKINELQKNEKKNENI